jgi:enoyl-CoA hydratase/carnithine racemase
MSSTPELKITHDGHVTLVEICRPPHNFFDFALIQQIAQTLEDLDQNPQCRAIVLASEGTAFCAGANFNSPDDKISRPENPGTNPLYFEAIRIFACKKPIVAAIHGPAVGGGLGLALVADFRVTCPEGRFSANFNRLGFHPGFGLSVTLPRLVGIQQANQLFFTGRRINGEEAVAIGLADLLVPQADVRAQALKLAHEIAVSAPLSLQSTRATLRQGLVAQLEQAVAHESLEQTWQFKTADFKEGVKAMTERREPQFQGR